MKAILSLCPLPRPDPTPSLSKGENDDARRIECATFRGLAVRIRRKGGPAAGIERPRGLPPF